MKTDNAFRLTVRLVVDLNEPPLATIDLALPASSTLAEMLDEILELAHAPRISKPWSARTAVGQQIDPTIPLALTQISQGSVLVLTPEQRIPDPVVRDATKAVVETGDEHSYRGAVTCFCGFGILGIAVLLTSPLLNSLHLSIKLAVLAGLALILLVWLPRAKILLRCIIPVLICLLLAFSTGLYINGDGSTVAISIVCGACAGIVAMIILHLVFHPVLLSTATTIVVLSCFLLFGITGICTKNQFIGAAAFTAACILLLNSFSPLISARVAGLSVPKLPSAGQDLKISDTPSIIPKRVPREREPCWIRHCWV